MKLLTADDICIIMLNMGKDICVLDIRSNTVTVAFGSAAGKGIVDIAGMTVENYDGYFDGQWLNTASLEDAVIKAYSKLPSHGSFDVLYTGVPAAFCDFYAEVDMTAINEDSVITRSIADKAGRRGLEAIQKTRNVIEHCPIGYRVDGGEVIFNPVGVSGKTLETYNTYISCKPGFSAAVDKLTAALGIPDTEYIPTMYAEAMTLMDYSYRAGGEVLADFGFLECSLAGVRGEGLQGLTSLTGGSAVVAADLTDSLDVDFYSALSLLGQIDLTNEFEQVTYYSVPKDGEVLKYRASEINDIVKSSLREQAVKLSQALSEVADEESTRRIFATGDAFFNIKGAIKYLAKSMGKAITPLAPNVPGYDKTQYSSLVSLLRQAQLKRNESGLFSRFINKLRRV